MALGERPGSLKNKGKRFVMGRINFFSANQKLAKSPTLKRNGDRCFAKFFESSEFNIQCHFEVAKCVADLKLRVESFLGKCVHSDCGMRIEIKKDNTERLLARIQFTPVAPTKVGPFNSNLVSHVIDVLSV